jgi:hypothetical protein
MESAKFVKKLCVSHFQLFQMAESGQIIEFSETRTEMESGDSVIARDTIDEAGIGIR